MRFIHEPFLVLIGICGFAAGVSAQTTVTLSTPGTHINADLTIQGGASGLVDSSTTDALVSKVSSPSYTRRILLKFDTQDYIPANAIIQSARLDLVLKSAESSEYRPLTAFNVTQSFVKGETNWYYFRPGQAWNTPGGDLGSSYGTTYVNDAVGSTYSFDLTDMVQRVVNGDFGSRYTRIALVDTGAWSRGNYRAFHSTRATDAALRPRLVIAFGMSTVTAAALTSAPTSTPTLPTTTGTTLRVMQWNIHKTKNSDGVCDPNRTVNTVVAQNVDVVSLNEVNFFAGVCASNFDMAAQLQSLIQTQTGLTWYMQDVNPNGVGNVLLSRYPLVSSSSTLLDYGRGVAQTGIVVNGRIVNLFSTHIEYYTSSWRPIQIAELVNWISNFSEPRIVMGDFNTWPATSDYYLIANPYVDGWVEANNNGVATAYNGTGSTEGSSRIDYVFYSNVAALALQGVNVPDTRVKGVSASDHDPVIAVFVVK